MCLLVEGMGDDVIDDFLCKFVVNVYVNLFYKLKFFFVLLKTMVWVFGEFGELSGWNVEMLMDMFVEVMEK